MGKIPTRYAPRSLGPRQQRLQKQAILRSRRAYKRGVYLSRPTRSRFKSKPSGHVARAFKMYKLPMNPTRKLAKRTGCKLAGLKKIIDKGEGAYYSSGSRPNQTAASWARARLASSLTGGPASRVDFKILQKTCKKNSRPLKLARKRMAQTGGSTQRRRLIPGMKEKLVSIQPSPHPAKKYRATIYNPISGRTRHIDFGASAYQQFKDSTGLGLYTKANHGDPKRRRAYFSRHSGVATKSAAIEKERAKSHGMYNAKLLSHEYLW